LVYACFVGLLFVLTIQLHMAFLNDEWIWQVAKFTECSRLSGDAQAAINMNRHLTTSFICWSTTKRS